MLGHGFVGGHLHTIGNRCWCGYLAVPARFHDRDEKGRVIGKGEERYLAWLASDEKPAYVNPPVMAEINRTESRTETIKRTVRTEKGRPKKWTNEAERLKAYRRRQ